MKPGRIIFLNGTSSAGKTTIAAILQESLEDLYLRVTIDDFFAMAPHKYLGSQPSARRAFFIERTDDGPIWRVGPLGHRVMSGMHAAVAALARTGNNVIVDTALWVRGWFEDAVAALHGLPVFYVQVYVPLDAALRRERRRGDREPGTTIDGYDVVYAAAPYDLRIDTSTCGPEECARRIMMAMQDPSSPSAFQRIYESRCTLR